MEALELSISLHGLIAPIVITEGNQLVAGERRLRACTSLGWEKIPAILRKDLSPIQAKELELEENVQRQALSWLEECKARAEIHTLKVAQYGAATPGPSGEEGEGGWRLEDTALSLGISTAQLSRDLKLAAEVDFFPEVATSKTKSEALKRLERRDREALVHLLAAKAKESPLSRNIIYGDCIEVMQDQIQPDSINMVVADPPYGVNLGTDPKLSSYGEPYPDVPADVLAMLSEALPLINTVLAPDSHAYIFFAFKHYTAIYNLLVSAFDYVDPVPYIWNKVVGGTPGYFCTQPSAYEPFFLCMKGQRKPFKIRGEGNVFSFRRVPPDQKMHLAEKPVEFLQELVELSSLPGDVVFDPFGGSGSTMEAAVRLGRSAITCEMRERYYKSIVGRISALPEDVFSALQGEEDA